MARKNQTEINIQFRKMNYLILLPANNICVIKVK
jgi:hypothetical protein